MSEIKDGGPAFPTDSGNCGINSGAPGMTLRDYFAIKCLPVVASASHRQGEEFLADLHFEDVADDAYLLADHMIRAREVQL